MQVAQETMILYSNEHLAVVAKNGEFSEDREREKLERPVYVSCFSGCLLSFLEK